MTLSRAYLLILVFLLAFAAAHPAHEQQRTVVESGIALAMCDARGGFPACIGRMRR